MLDPQARYRVREVRPQGVAEPGGRQSSAPFFDAINAADGAVLDGAWLALSGLPTPRAHAETAFIVQLDQEGV